MIKISMMSYSNSNLFSNCCYFCVIYSFFWTLFHPKRCFTNQKLFLESRISFVRKNTIKPKFVAFSLCLVSGSTPKICHWYEKKTSLLYLIVLFKFTIVINRIKFRCFYLLCMKELHSILCCNFSKTTTKVIQYECIHSMCS